MLVLSGSLLNRPVLSLRTGGQVAATRQIIVNPNNLKIEGFYCDDRFDNQSSPILVTQDIREILKQGFVIDDYEVLSQPDELVRMQKTLQINFQLIGKQVVTVNKEKVGKVTDWAAETETFYIQKLYVGRSLLKSLSTGQLSIDRSQIVEINDRKIVIQDLLKPEKVSAAASISAA